MHSRTLSLAFVTLLLASGAANGADLLRQYGSSAPLRTLALAARQGPSEPDPPQRLAVPRAANAAPVGAAVAMPPQYMLPSGPATPALPSVRTDGSSFNLEGLQAGAGGVTGALGEHQYVQLANGLMAVYRKQDGAVLLAVPANLMFADAPPGPALDACGARRGSGAQVQFDQLANRWIVSHRAWAPGQAASGPYYLCLAVSGSADATGSYYRYALPMRGAGGQARYFDDPQLAVWPDAYYLSVNLFDSPTGNYRGARICGVQRHALLRSANAPLRCRDLGDAYATVTPASLDGYATAPQGASPALFLALDFSAAGRGERLFMWRFSMSANRLDDVLVLPVAPYAIACPDGRACVGQPAPGAMLGAPGLRLMPRPVFRNDEQHGTLLANHAVQLADGQLAVRWYEIRDPLGAARVYQQGSFAPDSASRWMASIGMDKAGNIALGYSVASPLLAPGIRYTGRQRSDPPGRMQAEEVIFNGNGVQPDAADTARASGALALDPIDGCTFWYTQHYLPSTGPANWRTRISRFKFETCR
jgi:hypothetical protein